MPQREKKRTSPGECNKVQERKSHMSKKMRFGFLFFLSLITSALFSPSFIQAHPSDPPDRCSECCP